MLPLDERSRYAGGGLAWSRLPVLLAAAPAAAVAVAWLLHLAYVHNWYYIFLLPALAGLALGGVLYAAVGGSHCRNRWLAGAVGAAAGLAAYLGYFQFCLADNLPPGAAWRVDWLPRYIAFRMQTDVAEDVARPHRDRPKKPDRFLNWFTFGSELLMVVGMAAGFAWSRSRRAYCPELGRWMRRDVALFPTRSGPAVLRALAAGRLTEFVAGTPAGGDPQTACRLVVEHAAPSDGSVFDFPVYASIEDVPSPTPWYWPKTLRRTLLRQVELTPAEVLELRPLFPNLARLLETQHAELREAPGEVVPAGGPAGPVTEVAEVIPVPEPFRQRVRSPGYALWVNLHGLTPAAFFLGGLGLVAGGVWLISENSIPLGLAAVAVGAAGFLWGAYTGLYCLAVPENRWIERRLRAELGQRSDALVDPADPEAVYVSLIPRESFTRVRLTMASDLLLLKIDERGRRLLLEGDADRYRIPAGAVAVCEPQCFYHPLDAQHQNELWMARLVVQVEKGQRELLLSVNPTTWRPVTNARRRRMAEALCARVIGLRSPPQVG